MCVSLITVTHDREYQVPCGKCFKCLARRVSQWNFRLQKHARDCDSALFCTLTYAPACVPKKEGRLTLDKRDVQLFFKRLRKAHVGKPIKYYLVGEYGSDTWRPHYHAIIFNSSVHAIDNAWHLGSVHYGTVSGASIGYTLKYLHKGKRIPQYVGDPRLKEFSLMSKKLGINYLTPQMIKYHKAVPKDRTYVLVNGYKIAMPRYYKERLFDAEERALIAAEQRNDMLERQCIQQERAIQYFGEEWEQKLREMYDYQSKQKQRTAEQNRKKM